MGRWAPKALPAVLSLSTPMRRRYLIYIFGPGLKPAHDGSWPTPLKRWGMWRALQRYFNARLHKTADLDESKPYIFGFHPHGIMPVSVRAAPLPPF
jgi:hypothetical protein